MKKAAGEESAKGSVHGSKAITTRLPTTTVAGRTAMKPALTIPSGMLAIAIACVLSACGGGGGGDPVSDAVNSAAQDAAGRAGPATNPATGPAASTPEATQAAAAQPGAGAADAANPQANGAENPANAANTANNNAAGRTAPAPAANAAATDTNASQSGVRPAGNYWEIANYFFPHGDESHQTQGALPIGLAPRLPESAWPSHRAYTFTQVHTVNMVVTTLFGTKAGSADSGTGSYKGSALTIALRNGEPGVYTVVPSREALDSAGDGQKVILIVAGFGFSQATGVGPFEYVAQSGRVRVSRDAEGKLHLTSEGRLPSRRMWDHPHSTQPPVAPDNDGLALHDVHARYLCPEDCRP